MGAKVVKGKYKEAVMYGIAGCGGCVNGSECDAVGGCGGGDGGGSGGRNTRWLTEYTAGVSQPSFRLAPSLPAPPSALVHSCLLADTP